MTHGDRAVLAIQHWLHADGTAQLSVGDLAERAGLGRRTFLRRFVKATGLKPTEYHQRLRIARSREMLEFTRETIDEVALAVGYEDTRGFRRAFKRVSGVSPVDYRQRFQRNDRQEELARTNPRPGPASAAVRRSTGGKKGIA